MKVTAEMLENLGACSSQTELFRVVFPVGADLTPENVEKAQKAGLYIGWFANHFAPTGRCMGRCCMGHGKEQLEAVIDAVFE